MYLTNDILTPAVWRNIVETYGDNMTQCLQHPLTRYERIWHSQNGEEGVLEEIFSRIGTSNKYFVEFGAADGVWYSNTARFRDELGWRGLGLEGDPDKVEALGPLADKYNIKCEMVFSRNVNDLFQKYQVPPHFDLLSLDIDGDDYYVWKALTDFRPRVVIIETNPGIPNDVPLTIVEGETGCCPKEWQGYFGANLRCMYRLAKEKGYTFVTTVNFNAVFVEREWFHLLGCPYLTEDDAVKHCFKPRQYWYDHRDLKNRQWINPWNQ